MNPVDLELVKVCINVLYCSLLLTAIYVGVARIRKSRPTPRIMQNVRNPAHAHVGIAARRCRVCRCSAVRRLVASSGTRHSASNAAVAARWQAHAHGVRAHRRHGGEKKRKREGEGRER